MAEQPPIERAFFREAEDGTPVFFPWGLPHRGYRLDGQKAKDRALRAVSLLIGSTMAIGTWTAYRLQPLLAPEAQGPSAILAALAVPGVAMLLAILLYWLWASRFVEHFAESDLRVSREERLREAAALAGPGKIALVGVSVCGLSALLLWLEPHAWWLAGLGIALGLGTLGWSQVLRRAAAAPAPDAAPSVPMARPGA